MFKISAQLIQGRSILAIASCTALFCLTALPSQARPETRLPTTTPKATEAPKPLIPVPPKTPLPDYLETLRTAGPEGIAVVPSPIYADFQRAIQAGKAIRPEIEQMLQTGTPVGKIYAAALLGQFDPDAARSVLRSLQSDQTQIMVSLDPNIIVPWPSTVGKWATNILNDDTTWLPQATPKQPLPIYLERLRRAMNPGHGPAGAAAVPSQLYTDFKQAIRAGEQIRPEIEQMLQTGTPVGKVYAAALLMQFDPEVAQVILKSLQSNQTPINLADYPYTLFDINSSSTVGKWATQVLQGDTRWLPQAMPFSLQLAPPNKNYKELQRSLVKQQRFEEALEVAEQHLNYDVFKVWKTYTTGDKRDRLNTIAPPPNLAGIRNIAKSQTATLVEYSFVSDDLLYIWVIQPNGKIAFQSVDLTKSPTPLVKLIQQLHDRTQSSASSQQSSIAQQLYEILIAPIVSDLPRNPNDRVIFIPSGKLTMIPFAALQTASGQYLIETHTISVSPSIQFLALTQAQRRAAATTGQALIVGNPIHPYRDVEQAPVPAAEKEARAIAALMGTQPLVGPKATKLAAMRTIATSNLIHFATNGFADFGDPRLPGSIVLGLSQGDDGQIIDEGSLTAIEVANFQLNANLVVLSTGNLGQRLPQAFLIGGAASVLAPIGQADDVKGAMLMIEFYRQLKINPNKAVALRQAMLTMRRQHPDPHHWATFNLIGEAE